MKCSVRACSLTLPGRTYLFTRPGTTCVDAALQIGHWRSRNSVTVTLAELLPSTPSCSGRPETSAAAWAAAPGRAGVLAAPPEEMTAATATRTRAARAAAPRRPRRRRRAVRSRSAASALSRAARRWSRGSRLGSRGMLDMGTSFARSWDRRGARAGAATAGGTRPWRGVRDPARGGRRRGAARRERPRERAWGRRRGAGGGGGRGGGGGGGGASGAGELPRRGQRPERERQHRAGQQAEREQLQPAAAECGGGAAAQGRDQQRLAAAGGPQAGRADGPQPERRPPAGEPRDEQRRAERIGDEEQHAGQAEPAVAGRLQARARARAADQRCAHLVHPRRQQ